MTHQPVWKFIANLGDVSPIEYGGYFIFEDTTGVYDPEAEYWDADDRTAYRFDLEPLVVYAGHLFPARQALHFADGSLPHPIAGYIVWFDDHIDSIASTSGIDPQELRRLFCSADVLERAHAYRNLGEHFGWTELDQYPVVLTKREAEERYNKYTGG